MSDALDAVPAEVDADLIDVVFVRVCDVCETERRVLERCPRQIFVLAPDHPLADCNTSRFPKEVMPRRRVVLTWGPEQIRCPACVRTMGWYGEEDALTTEAEPDEGPDDILDLEEWPWPLRRQPSSTHGTHDAPALAGGGDPDHGPAFQAEWTRVRSLAIEPEVGAGG
jgi:hypothetical protein